MFRSRARKNGALPVAATLDVNGEVEVRRVYLDEGESEIPDLGITLHSSRDGALVASPSDFSDPDLVFGGRLCAFTSGLAKEDLCNGDVVRPFAGAVEGQLPPFVDTSRIIAVGGATFTVTEEHLFAIVFQSEVDRGLLATDLGRDGSGSVLVLVVPRRKVIEGGVERPNGQRVTRLEITPTLVMEDDKLKVRDVSAALRILYDLGADFPWNDDDD